MSRGGKRPGAGRPKGAKGKQPAKSASVSVRVSNEHKERFYQLVPTPERARRVMGWIDDGCPTGGAK